MDRLTRTEALGVLRSMGVDMPIDTKLSDDNVQKRLRDALNLAQQKPQALDLHALAQWPVLQGGLANSSGRSVLDAVSKSNLAEAAMNYARNDRELELFVDPFMDLRQTVLGVGSCIDKGMKWCTVQDQRQEQCAINLRFVSVLEVDEHTPAIIVLYCAIYPSMAMDGAQWVSAQMQTNSAPAFRGMFPNIKATPLEQKLLLTLLKMNHRLVPANLQVERHPTEAGYELSVLFPLGPLDFAAITKLSHNMGCGICGERGTSRCAQCLSVSYCGAECQRADWSQHKKTCRQLKGGRWHPVPVHAGLRGMEDMYMATVNRFTSTSADAAGLSQKIDPNAVPPNVWGDRLFIIKIQFNLLGPDYPPHMMVYDRKRSFQVFVRGEDIPELFHAMLEEMRGPRGGYGGIKMYRWARRTGDWELNVCLDRQPPQVDTMW